MDTIDTFLDAMFAPYPSTPRLLEAKGELRAMMEDAYADAVGRGRTHNEAVGQVITDFGNLEELAPVLGILPDIRSAQAGTAGAATDPAGTSAAPDPAAAGTAAGAAGAAQADPAAAGAAAPLPQDEAASDYPIVTLPEAQALAEARRRTGRLLGRGVALFVLAPIPLIVAANLIDGGDSETGLSRFSDVITDGLTDIETISGSGGRWAVLIGFAMTLVLVATGVLTLMRRHQAFVGLEHLTDGKFTRNPIVSAWAARLRVENEGPRSRALMAAVGLWILSAIPAVAGGILSDQPDRPQYFFTFGASLTLALVAAGLLILLPTTWASSTHETLTEEGRSTGAPGQWEQWDRWGRKDADNPLIGAIASIYWPLTLVIFLAWGFLGNGWAICWIVWPISGILFGAIASFISALCPRRRARR